MPQPSGDALLAAVARSRDREAFRHLFIAYGPRIKRYLCARGATAALAEEVVQEVMLKVWRKASLYDPVKASAGTWVYSIARSCLAERQALPLGTVKTRTRRALERLRFSLRRLHD